MVVEEDKRTNKRTMLPTLKINATAGYQAKIEVLKGAGLLFIFIFPTLKPMKIALNLNVQFNYGVPKDVR